MVFCPSSVAGDDQGGSVGVQSDALDDGNCRLRSRKRHCRQSEPENHDRNCFPRPTAQHATTSRPFESRSRAIYSTIFGTRGATTDEPSTTITHRREGSNRFSMPRFECFSGRASRTRPCCLSHVCRVEYNILCHDVHDRSSCASSPTAHRARPRSGVRPHATESDAEPVLTVRRTTAVPRKTRRRRPGPGRSTVEARRVERPSGARNRRRRTDRGGPAAARAALGEAPALAVVAGCLLLAGCGAPHAASRMDPGRATAGPAPSSAVVERPIAFDRSLDRLLGRTPRPVHVRRNIFRFESSADSEPDPPRARRRRRAVAPSIRRGAPAEPLPAAAPARPPAPDPGPALRFIGIVEARDRGRRVAVLADEHGIRHGNPGEIVGGRYRVIAVDVTSVQLDDLLRGARMTLRFNETGRPR